MLTNLLMEVKTMSEHPSIARLGQIQIRTHDVERAAEFYEKVLGL